MNLNSARKFPNLIVLGLIFLLSHSGEAGDCGCPKPKVKITSGQGPNPVFKVFFNGNEVADNAPPVEVEKDKNHKLTIKVIGDRQPSPGEPTLCSPGVIINFPHCTIEYSIDNGAHWTQGTSKYMGVVGHVDQEVIVYRPESVLLRITKAPSDDANGSSEAPGGGSNGQSSPPGYQSGGLSGPPVLTPPGMSMEIPMGAASTPEGFRSAGLLARYGPVTAGSASPSNLRYNSIPEVSSAVSQHTVRNNQNLATEQHFIVPQGVLRVRGWSSATQSAVDWQGAQETLVEVYARESYEATTHTFSGSPHSYYRMEIATGSGLQPGLRLVHSNFGIVSTRAMQATADGLYLREVEGDTVSEWQVIPPAANSSSWQRRTTVTQNGVVISTSSEVYELMGIQYVVGAVTEDPNPTITGDELVTYHSYYSDGRKRSVSKPDGSWFYYIYDYML